MRELVVRREDGSEYARHEGLICQGDPWIITGPDPESTPDT